MTTTGEIMNMATAKVENVTEEFESVEEALTASADADEVRVVFQEVR